jgi:hypothetical protein
MSAHVLLTGIAALLVTSCQAPLRTAHAAEIQFLPDYLQGRWCHTPFASTEAQQVYFRPDIHDPEITTCGDLTDGIMLEKDSYEDESPAEEMLSCVLDKIEQVNEYTYLTQVRCSPEGKWEKPSFEGQEEFQLVNGLLFKKRMPQG